MDVILARAREDGIGPRIGRGTSGGQELEGGVGDKWLGNWAKEPDIVAESKHDIHGFCTRRAIGDEQEDTVVGIISVGIHYRFVLIVTAGPVGDYNCLPVGIQLEALRLGGATTGLNRVEERLGLSGDLVGVTVRQMAEDDIVLGKGITSGLSFERHSATPGIKLACYGFQAGRGERVDRNLGKELTGCGRGGHCDSKQPLDVLKMNLRHVWPGYTGSFTLWAGRIPRRRSGCGRPTLTDRAWSCHPAGLDWGVSSRHYAVGEVRCCVRDWIGI